MAGIDPLARVDPRAELGAGVEVGAYSIVGPGVAIGDGTRMGHHVVLEGPASIGPGCRIGHYSSLGTAPQDIGYGGEPTRLVVGKGVYFGEYANASRGTVKDRGETTIGDGCYLMSYVHVGHDCVLAPRVMISNATQLSGHIQVGEGAYLSGVIGVGQFIRIGTFSITSGGSALNQDVPPYGMVAGVTAVLVGVNLVGLKRNGFAPEDIADVKKAYRILFMSGKPMKQALAEVRERFAASERVRVLVEFVESSKKGVCRMRRAAREGG